MLYFNAYTYKGHLNLENRKHLEYLENPDFEYLHSLDGNEKNAHCNILQD